MMKTMTNRFKFTKTKQTGYKLILTIKSRRGVVVVRAPVSRL